MYLPACGSKTAAISSMLARSQDTRPIPVVRSIVQPNTLFGQLHRRPQWISPELGKGKIDDADFDDWDAMIDTNIKGLLSMTQYVSARMRKQNSGHIINVGSIAGYEAYPGGSVYCATKHAVRAITQAAKMDLSGTRVRVSSVSPGLVNTEFSQVRFRGNKKEADEVYKDITPLTGADIAEIIIFIANRPPHVNILDTIVFPVAQSSATIVARNKQL